MAQIARQVYADRALAEQSLALAEEVSAALKSHGRTSHCAAGEILAYETDGYGNTLQMDDANAPSLLSLPYLGCCDIASPLYQRTRHFVLSPDNPYFFRGTAAEGVGGPHVGVGYVWPMAIIMRALTSTNDREIAACLRTLRNTTAGTNFMHESFNVNDPSDYTRAWFAWANTLFGELLLRIDAERPWLLKLSY